MRVAIAMTMVGLAENRRASASPAKKHAGLRAVKSLVID